MNMREIREAARGPMKNFCKLCPVCDGRACAELLIDYMDHGLEP